MSVYRAPPWNPPHAATPFHTIRSIDYPGNGGVFEEGGGEAKEASPRTSRLDDHRLEGVSFDEGEQIAI